MTSITFGQSEPRFSPDGLLDTVSDKYGNRIPIGNIYIPTAKFGTAQIQSVIVSTCQAGYFTLHFESGSVFDLSASARTVACKVFEDLSNFLPSNIPLGSIHIHCGSPIGSGLAEASPYFVFPSNLANQNQGIIDGQVYKAIVSGVNPYLTIPLSLINANQIYHGFVNAATTSTATPWNYNVTTTTIASNEFDMYSVLLHEAIHSLGFLSLMRFDGLSAFTPTIFGFPYSNYYHRYDLFLHDKNGNPLLSAPVGSCAISNLTFAPASASVIGAGMATSTLAFSQNSTNCSEGAKYIGSTTATVYTPHFFEPGSSLSHFEDMCSGPYSGTCVATYTPGNNDLYYVMSNFTDPGPCYVKRHPTPEERLVLCDLGYSVNTVFGGTAVAGSSLNYSGGACSPTNIVGHNDGYINGQFTLQVVALSSTVIPFAALLANDSPSTGLSVSCMDLVTNNATLSLGSTDFSVTVAPGGGLVVLKYIPRNATGQIGNATFVFINFVPQGCSSCGIVNNGGFEYSIPGQHSCGFLQNSNSNQPKLDCWTVYGSNYWADLLTTVCPNSTPHELGVNTQYISPPISTVALGAGTNTNALGLMYATNGSTGAVVNSLNSPLVNGQTYEVSFWILNYGGAGSPNSINWLDNPVVLSLASTTAPINPYSPTAAGFPNGLDVLANFTIAAGKTWSQITHTFVYNPISPATQIIFGINPNLTTSPATFTPGLYYCFVDEFSIIEVPGPSFSILNNTVCSSASINDLAQFTGTTSGTFSGPGVSFDGINYHFNSPATMTPGVYGIAFTYSATNCQKTIFQSVVVENCCNSPSIPGFTGSAVTSNSVFSGPLRFPNSFTVQSGASLFLNGEFMIAPNVSITVENNAQLIALGAHMYACTDMWEGIVVQSGGKIIMTHHNGMGNLIEDAIRAISLSNYTSSLAPVLTINNTVFNRNYISIEASNYTLATSSAFEISDNVFTSRYLPFDAAGAWSQPSLTGLRSAAGGTNVLHGPFGLQNAAPATLKVPHTGEFPRTAIWLNSTGNTSGTYPSLTFSGIQIGHTTLTNPEDHFNLFDCHRTFIKAYNSNLKLINNVFQNALVNNTEAAIHFTTTSADKQLDMSASQVNIGNRLYDFYNGVHAINACDLKIENAIFRTSNGPNTSTVCNGYSLGKGAIHASSSKMRDYSIINNEFINFYFSVALGSPGGTVNSVAIQSNTFSPTLSTTFTGTTVNHLNQPITLSSPLAVYSPSGSAGISINNNLIHRGWNGILLNGLSLEDQAGACGAPLTIEDNSIVLEEINNAPLQHGIRVVNNRPLYTGTGCPWPSVGTAGFRSVKDNTVSLLNGNLNTAKVSLFYTFNSAGISTSPLFMTCNEASDAHEGFVFEGYEPGVYWRGNKMTNLARGMTLKSGGVIGQQGSQTGTASDNEWLGSAWTSTNYGIYTSASQATNSPIVRWTSPAQYDPPNLWGDSNDPPQWYYSTGNGSIITYTGSNYYSCGVTYTQMPSITLPDEENYESENLWYMAQTATFRALHFNEDLRNSQTEYSDFHSLFENSIMEAMAEIEFSLVQQDLATASSMLAALAAEDLNDVEQNYFSFYELFLAYTQSGTLTENEQGELSNLCALCPAMEGACIFQARALYQTVTGAPFEAEPCVGDEGARKAIKSNEKTVAGYTRLRAAILPNPAIASVAIRLNKKTNGISVNILDVSGRQVLKTFLPGESSQFELHFNLASGVYFFNISNGIENVTEKVIVTK